jgi:hypothetical protein
MPLRFGTVVLNALATADALDDAEVADGPPWPPKGSKIRASRAKELLAHFEGEEDVEPSPTPKERASYDSFCTDRDVWRATPSKNPNKVPGFKFGSNDGWIVSKGEAAIIAKALAEVLGDDDSFELLCDILDVTRREDAGLRAALEKFRVFNAKTSKGEGYAVF